MIAYNGQWTVAKDGKIFQYNNLNSGGDTWNNRINGWNYTILSANLGSGIYSYITLDPSSNFKISGTNSRDPSTNGSLSFSASDTIVKGNSRKIGPSTLSYVYGCYATLSFTNDSIVTLQVGFSSAAQNGNLSFTSSGTLIFRAYI